LKAGGTYCSNLLMRNGVVFMSCLGFVATDSSTN